MAFGTHMVWAARYLSCSERMSRRGELVRIVFEWRDEPRLTSWGCARMLFYTTIVLSASLVVFDVESFAIVGFQ